VREGKGPKGAERDRDEHRAVTIGDELFLGSTLTRMAPHLASELAAIGVSIVRSTRWRRRESIESGGREGAGPEGAVDHDRRTRSPER